MLRSNARRKTVPGALRSDNSEHTPSELKSSVPSCKNHRAADRRTDRTSIYRS